MNTPLRLLLIEDDEDDASLTIMELKRGGFELSSLRIDTGSAMEKALTEGHWDLIICDHVMPAFSSSMALDILRSNGQDIPFIIVSSVAPEDLVTAAMRSGAHDFISKGSLVRLVPAVQRELREATVRRERHQIALKLKESENRYTHLFNENPAPMLLVEASTLMVVDANPAAAVFFGHALEALKQATISALSRLSRTGDWKNIQRAKDLHGRIFADQMLLADGSLREVDVYAVRIQHGNRSLLLVTLFDQTERKAAEESMIVLVAAVEQVTEAIAITDPSGTITYANKAFQNLTGSLASTAKGWSLKDILEQEEVWKALREAAHGNPWEGRLTIRTVDGKSVEVDANCSPVRNTSGVISHLVTVMRDITKEIELERELRQAVKMDALGELAAGIAHDSNNILTAILTSAELIKCNLPPESPLISKADVILQAGLCAAGLNKQILSFSHKSVEKPRPLDLSTIARDALQMLRSSLPDTIQIRSELVSGIWVEGDPVLLHQVILNLAINAFHAMRPKGGLLQVSLTETLIDEHFAQSGICDGRYALLTMKDSGCGMDASTMERIFDPFFTTKPQGEGTGLGLSIVHASVTKARGKITVSSELGHGAQFNVYWPCVTGLELPTDARLPDDVSGNESILLVDDEELVAALAKLGLQNLGYQVTTLTNAVKALEEFTAHPDAYDLVFTDLAMPELNGIELACRIQKLRPSTPILLMSGLPLASALSLNSQARFQTIVAKPFTAHDLADAARKALVHTQKTVQKTVESKDTESAAPSHSQQGHPRKKGLILLAEDSHMTRTMVRTWLERSGCEVVEAQDGLDAWELFTKGPNRGQFGLVLTDVVMPRMDGLELAQLIRKSDPAIPIAILTSNEDKDTVKSALNLGVNEFLNKPFEAPELIQCVERLLAERQSRMINRRSVETAQAVRMAQKALVAIPEKDLPLFSLYEPLTDAGGDVFRCMKCADGSILFILADVAGHSVLSSYAVASFLAMLSTYVGECNTLMALTSAPGSWDSDASNLLHSCGQYGKIPCDPLRHLALKFNQGIQNGPFSEVPICVLLGLWTPSTGHLKLLNAGIPHGLFGHRGNTNVFALEINGTPLGIFPEPMVEECSLLLEPGNRLLFGTDGFFDVVSSSNQPFFEIAQEKWAALRESPIDWALSVICEEARNHGNGVIADDLLVICFEQPQVTQALDDLVLNLPSIPRAIDMACDRLSESIKGSALGGNIDKGRLFDILLAVREALSNAVIHGNRSRPEAFVTLRCRQQADHGNLVISVTDEGRGFDLKSCIPPKDPLSDRGRGIPLIQAHARDVRMVGSQMTMTFHLEEMAHDNR